MADTFLLSPAGAYSVPSDPAWAALLTIGRHLDGAAAFAVRERLLSPVSQDDWTQGFAAAERVFGCADQSGHCFRVEPDGWLSLIETQVTRGLAYFLEGRVQQSARHARIAALINACGDPAGEQVTGSDVVSGAAVAEVVLSAKVRPDLVVYARLRNGTDRLLVIEGKMGHQLSKGQLDNYLRGVPEITAANGLHCRHEDMTLAVIGSRLRTSDAAELASRKQWRFLTWRDLVLRLEQQLRDHDDEHFRRFRRTIWSQCW